MLKSGRNAVSRFRLAARAASLLVRQLPCIARS
jgi:hypothetical protein